MNSLAIASRALGPPHRRRMRHRRLPTTRPTPRGLQEPSYPRKKCAIWARWRPVPGKNANYLRAPSLRRSGLVGPHTTPPIVNYKYMTSTRREGYFWLPTLGTWTSLSGPRLSRSIMKQMIASWFMVRVHGLMVAGAGLVPILSEIMGPRDRRPAPSIFGSRSNVVHNQAGLAGPSRNRSAWNANLFYNSPVWGLSGAPRTYRRPRRTGKSVDCE